MNANDYERLAKDQMVLAQGYLEAAAHLRAQEKKESASRNERSVPAFDGIGHSKVEHSCLCGKCVNGRGACKNPDPWMNYTAWMNYTG